MSLSSICGGVSVSPFTRDQPHARMTAGKKGKKEKKNEKKKRKGRRRGGNISKQSRGLVRRGKSLPRKGKRERKREKKKKKEKKEKKRERKKEGKKREVARLLVVLRRPFTTKFVSPHVCPAVHFQCFRKRRHE